MYTRVGNSHLKNKTKNNNFIDHRETNPFSSSNPADAQHDNERGRKRHESSPELIGLRPASAVFLRKTHHPLRQESITYYI